MIVHETSLEKIKADLRRYAQREGRPVTFGFVMRMFFLTAGFQFVFTRRLQDIVRKVPIVGRLLRRIVWWWSCIVFGSELAIAAEIGGGFYIPHPFGIVIGSAKIGRNVTILQNVTIGKKGEGDAGDPTLEDGVFVGAGAVVLGPIVLGKNASVGANSVLLKDLPENASAVGIPAKIRLKTPEPEEVTL